MPDMHPLVEESMKKAAIAWLTVAERPSYPVWCLWVEGALYLVSGAQEQPAPGLDGADTAMVSARGDHGGRIVTWPASVQRVEPGSDQWTSVVPQLAGKRLNSAGAEALAARWAESSIVWRLTPAGDPAEAGETLPDESLAEPARPTPAKTAAHRPFRLHKVRGAR
jgi:hypothetical protein